MNLKLISLVILSTLATIFVMDQLVLRSLGIANFADFGNRYSVNGVASGFPGYVSNSDKLAFENKKNIELYFEDVFAYPREITIHTDEFGYRNPIGNFKRSATALVGDSIVFGYSSQEGETIRDLLSEKIPSEVYNISAPGWGPAEYMRAFDTLEAIKEFNQVYLIFSLPNDDMNLMNSCWPDDDKRPPSTYHRVLRSDIGDRIYAPPIFLISSPLRHSRIALLIYAVLEGLPARLAIQNKAFLDTSSAAVTQASMSLEALKTGKCVRENHRLQIAKIQNLLEDSEFSKADQLSYALSHDLIAEGCYPVVEASSFGRPIIRKMNYNFVSRYNIAQLSTTKKDAKGRNSRCENSVSAKSISTYQRKQTIFSNWILELAKTKIVKVFLLPGEYQLAELPSDNEHWLCKAIMPKVQCSNLIKDFQDEYKSADQALYADGVHLNFLGTKFLVRLMASDL